MKGVVRVHTHVILPSLLILIFFLPLLPGKTHATPKIQGPGLHFYSLTVPDFPLLSPICEGIRTHGHGGKNPSSSRHLPLIRSLPLSISLVLTARIPDRNGLLLRVLLQTMPTPMKLNHSMLETPSSSPLISLPLYLYLTTSPSLPAAFSPCLAGSNGQAEPLTGQ